MKDNGATAATGMSDRWTETDMVTLAARGVGKVDALGPRGATLCSVAEIEAMAGLLAVLGLPPIPPGTAAEIIVTQFMKGLKP
ncbi:hypothetical protein RNZ50_15790 [Paracoccaceae bacterium Fryx2]|nr:hypothetical protein [Paracoccaceae bacterium Fryx2]